MQQNPNMHQWTNWEQVFSTWSVRAAWRNSRKMLERCFLCGPCRDVLSRQAELSEVNSSWWVSEWVTGLLRLSSCDPLLWAAGSWGTGIVREPRGRGTSAVGSRHAAATGEDTTNWENSVRVVVNCSVCILAIALVTCSYDMYVFNKSS
jgi:hypothetical protein